MVLTSLGSSGPSSSESVFRLDVALLRDFSLLLKVAVPFCEEVTSDSSRIYTIFNWSFLKLSNGFLLIPLDLLIGDIVYFLGLSICPAIGDESFYAGELLGFVPLTIKLLNETVVEEIDLTLVLLGLVPSF